MEAESQTADYFFAVSGRFRMPLWICGDSHRSVRKVHQSRAKGLGLSSVVLLVEVPSFPELVVNGDTLYSAPAWTDANKVFPL